MAAKKKQGKKAPAKKGNKARKAPQSKKTAVKARGGVSKEALEKKVAKAADTAFTGTVGLAMRVLSKKFEFDSKQIKKFEKAMEKRKEKVLG